MRISKVVLLVKTLLKSTSISNKLKYEKDPKKKRKLIGNLIAYGILFIYMLALAIFMGYSYQAIGLSRYVPALSIMLVSSLTFILTFFGAHSYLLDFKTKDYLLSLPFSIKEIVLARFIFMYIKGLTLQMLFVTGFIISQIVFLKPSILFCLVWFILGLIVPIISTALSAFIGMLIGKVTSKFKFKKLLQVLLSFAIITLSMFSNTIINSFVKENDMSVFMIGLANKINDLSSYFMPAKWTEEILFDKSILSFLYVLLVILLVVFIFVEFTSKIFIKVSSNLSISLKSKNKVSLNFKKHSVVNTIAYKEFKRFMGSPSYTINAGFGLIFALIIAGASIIIGGDNLIMMFSDGISVPKEFIIPIIPLIIYLFIGMVSTTCVTPSLEGKNYWIVQSLPITKKKLYLGKILFNIELNLPIAIIATLCLAVSFKATLFEALIIVLTEIFAVLFSTMFGLITGDKFMKLDFENDVEVVKQSAAVTIYLFVNMLVTIAIGFLVIYLKIDTGIYNVIFIPLVVYIVLSTVSYFVVKRFCW